MTEKSSSNFVPMSVIREKMAATEPWEAAAFYGVDWPQLPPATQIRLPCPFNEECQTSSYGQLNVSLSQSHNPIYCHACHTRGDLLTLMWGWKHGCPPSTGKLRGA